MIKNCPISIASIPLILIFVLPSFFACRHEPDYLDELDTVCFNSQVLPLIQVSCGITGCHDAGSAQEGFVAVDYASIVSAVTPGDARGSLLYKVITDINGESMMPPDRPLSKAQRMLIQVWISQGAGNTTCSNPIISPVDTSASDSLCFVQDVLPILLSSCGITGCHDVTTHREGYVFVNYSTLMQRNESIVPFYPSQSKVYQVITENEPEDRMPPPPFSSLTTEQIQSLRGWIEEGALNSDCPDPAGCDTTGTISFSGIINPLIQTNCISCHNASYARGGVNLDGYGQVKYYADSMVNSVSMLAGVTSKLPGFPGMPPNGTLSYCSKRQIIHWIEQGKLNN